MHLQQTKRGSLSSGGPQYYFHNLTDPIKIYLRKVGAVRVALVTPYGATKSDYFALSKDHKFGQGGQVISGSVGHDRIQQGQANESIGEAIRKWYNLASSNFERIDIDIEVIEDIFYLTPLKYKFDSSKKEIELVRVERPLTFIKDYVSPFWKKQIRNLQASKSATVAWALTEICRIVKDYQAATKVAYIQETDILRASGSLKVLGVALGAYVGKGYDCVTEFNFLDYPTYTVPVEVKKYSKGFDYQLKKYGKDELSRAVLLCAVHNLKNVPKNIDVIELDALCDYYDHL